MERSMRLVVGLGNPGKRYAGTRHNVGFEAVEQLARQGQVSWRRSWRFSAELAEVTVAEERLLLCRPTTFMNRSGLAVGPILRKKGFALADLIVIVDDTELDCGRIRIRRRGSAGGHNGLKSMIAVLGSDEFARIRIGVGGRPGERAMIEHVLSGFAPDDREKVDQAIARAVAAVACMIKDGLDKAMNEYNG
jgi:peptidyl-tRNA hydrolase, PTH1 family